MRSHAGHLAYIQDLLIKTSLISEMVRESKEDSDFKTINNVPSCLEVSNLPLCLLSTIFIKTKFQIFNSTN